MTPSPNWRSGYSRRAQYSTFIGYSLGVLGAIIGAALLVISMFNPEFFSGARSVASGIAEPPGALTARGRDAGQNVIATIRGYFLAGSSHAQLERELAKAKVLLTEARATEEENERLRKLLNLAEKTAEPVVTTRLTSSTATSSRRFATLGAGRDRGVRTGMPVRSELGLIGRVLEVGRSSARVLLITDTDSLVPVRRADDGVPAFAQGRGDGRLQIRLLNLGINPLENGDTFVTSGSGGLYRPGTPIAVVTKVTSDGAIAQVIANPAATEYVLVQPSWGPESPTRSANVEKSSGP